MLNVLKMFKVQKLSNADLVTSLFSTGFPHPLVLKKICENNWWFFYKKNSQPSCHKTSGTNL